MKYIIGFIGASQFWIAHSNYIEAAWWTMCATLLIGLLCLVCAVNDDKVRGNV